MITQQFRSVQGWLMNDPGHPVPGQGEGQADDQPEHQVGHAGIEKRQVHDVLNGFSDDTEQRLIVADLRRDVEKKRGYPERWG